LTPPGAAPVPVAWLVDRTHPGHSAAGEHLPRYWLGDGVMQGAQELADLEDPLVGVRMGVGDPALDVGQDLPPLVVVAVAHDPGGAGVADLLQVPQECVHRWGPGAGWTQDRGAVADGSGGLAVGAGQGLMGGLGCHLGAPRAGSRRLNSGVAWNSAGQQLLR